MESTITTSTAPDITSYDISLTKKEYDYLVDQIIYFWEIGDNERDQAAFGAALATLMDFVLQRACPHTNSISIQQSFPSWPPNTIYCNTNANIPAENC